MTSDHPWLVFLCLTREHLPSVITFWQNVPIIPHHERVSTKQVESFYISNWTQEVHPIWQLGWEEVGLYTVFIAFSSALPFRQLYSVSEHEKYCGESGHPSWRWPFMMDIPAPSPLTSNEVHVDVLSLHSHCLSGSMMSIGQSLK